MLIVEAAEPWHATHAGESHFREPAAGETHHIEIIPQETETSRIVPDVPMTRSKPAAEIWSEIWPTVGRQAETVTPDVDTLVDGAPVVVTKQP